MGELASMKRYAYWSDRRVQGICEDNSLSLERRWLIEAQSPSALSFLPQVGLTEQFRVAKRHEDALKLEKSIGQLAVEDFVTPPPAHFAKGRGPVTIAAYTRWNPQNESERKGVIINTRTVSGDGSRVEVCLFGSTGHCTDYVSGSAVEAPMWSSSSTWAIEEFIANKGRMLAPIYDDDESIAVEIVRVFNNEGMNGKYAFKRLPDAEWFAEVYHDVELDKERWDQRPSGDWPQPVDRIIVGAPLWVRSVI